MCFYEFAEKGNVREFKIVCNFLYAQVGMRQETADVFCGIFNYPFIGGLSTIGLAYIRQVFLGYAELLAVEIHVSRFYFQ